MAPSAPTRLEQLLSDPPPGVTQTFDQVTVPLALRFEQRERNLLRAAFFGSWPLGGLVGLLGWLTGLDAASAAAVGVLVAMVVFALVMGFFLMPREDRGRVSSRELVLGERSFRMSEITSIGLRRPAEPGARWWLEVQCSSGQYRWRTDRPQAAEWLVELVRALHEQQGRPLPSPELERLRKRAIEAPAAGERIRNTPRIRPIPRVGNPE